VRISTADLVAQYRRAVVEWPWVSAVERAAALPPMLLWAVGSRETNLRNVVGDGGHGVGIWQRDRRAHVLPGSVDWYLGHPRRQADDAAALLADLRRDLGTWPRAIAAYNAGPAAVRAAMRAGVDPDTRTTGGDYAADVESRQLRLLVATGHPAAQTTGGTMPSQAMLSAHFSAGEMACRHCGEVRALPELLEGLERLRSAHYATTGLVVVSAYRCRTHNAAVGGAAVSQHRYGAAADVPMVATLDQVQALGVFSGIGWQWVGRLGRRRRLVRHVDVRHASPVNPTSGSVARPSTWQYA